jgi:1,4-dihydroxy-2-naphthoate octaprenyltransferase
MSSSVGLAPPLPRPGSAGAWLLACRVKTLPAAVAPVLLGSALALHEGHFRWLPGLLALGGALLLQITSNFANDVLDFEKGADTDERVGPVRAVQAGLLTPRAMKLGLGVVILLLVALGSAFAFLVGPSIIVIGVASIVAALAYTGGPYPLAYLGLGDLFVFLFFGLVAVLGTVHVHGAPITPLAVLFAAAAGALSTNILIVNNVRDRETDKIAGKRTTAVRFGRSFAEWQYTLLAALSFLAPAVAFLFGWAEYPVLLPLLAFPLALKARRHLLEREGALLNPVLGESARVLLVFGVLAALGLVGAHFAQKARPSGPRIADPAAAPESAAPAP